MSRKQVIPAFDGVFPASPVAARPTKVFKDSLALSLKGETRQLCRYTPPYTDTDISVFFKNANVLHTGDT